MAIIDVKYVKASNLSAEEKKELGITVPEGLVAIQTTNPTLKRTAIVVDNYVEHLLSLGDEKSDIDGDSDNP
ncbi:MAG: hypothetical protein Q8L34_03060 [Candidatus Woesearchaeota archaeon]|nr:hypothetical protein [Candidatus Woesearchaeota archaeon]